MTASQNEQSLQRATTRDGQSLGYSDSGGSGIALINPLSYRTTLSGLAETTSQRPFLAAVGAGHQLVIYDQRGVGASKEAGPSQSWEQRGEDLWAIADAAGVERAVLYGVFDGGYTIAHAALQQPDRVLGLVFNFVPPVFVATSDYPYGLPAATVAEAYGSAIQSDHGRQMLAMRSVGINEADAALLVFAWERDAPAATLDQLKVLLQKADLRPIAPSVPVRSLVIEPQRRALIAGWGRALADLLPRGRLIHPANTGEMLGGIHGFLAIIQIDEGNYASKVSSAFSTGVGDAKRSVTSLHRILVPVVDTLSSERAAEMACRLGAEQQAEIVLVHVIEVPLTRSLADVSKDERERGLKALHFGQAIVAQHGLQSRIRDFTERSAATGILRAAADEHADLIVMAMGEKRGRDPSKVGRTMQEVLRRAPCEVLIDQSHGVNA
ncbi:MAG: alpha/beta fold hydrolase [Dehalococcoidia bacterium]